MGPGVDGLCDAVRDMLTKADAGAFADALDQLPDILQSLNDGLGFTIFAPIDDEWVREASEIRLLVVNQIVGLHVVPEYLDFDTLFERSKGASRLLATSSCRSLTLDARGKRNVVLIDPKEE